MATTEARSGPVPAAGVRCIADRQLRGAASNCRIEGERSGLRVRGRGGEDHGYRRIMAVNGGSDGVVKSRSGQGRRRGPHRGTGAAARATRMAAWARRIGSALWSRFPRALAAAKDGHSSLKNSGRTSTSSTWRIVRRTPSS